MEIELSPVLIAILPVFIFFLKFLELVHCDQRINFLADAIFGVFLRVSLCIMCGQFGEL